LRAVLSLVLDWATGERRRCEWSCRRVAWYGSAHGTRCSECDDAAMGAAADVTEITMHEAVSGLAAVSVSLAVATNGRVEPLMGWSCNGGGSHSRGCDRACKCVELVWQQLCWLVERIAGTGTVCVVFATRCNRGPFHTVLCRPLAIWCATPCRFPNTTATRSHARMNEEAFHPVVVSEQSCRGLDAVQQPWCNTHSSHGMFGWAPAREVIDVLKAIRRCCNHLRLAVLGHPGIKTAIDVLRCLGNPACVDRRALRG
jgi:hypothetical protein